MITAEPAITKDQITNLLLDAWGFAIDTGMVYCCHESMIRDNDFELASPDGDYLTFTYEGATFINGTVNFMTDRGNIESFTVLIAATNDVSINGQIAEDALLS